MGESQHADPDLSDSSIVLEIRILTVLGTVADFLVFSFKAPWSWDFIGSVWHVSYYYFPAPESWIILDGWRGEGVVEVGVAGRGRASGRIKSMVTRDRSLRLRRIRSESLGELDNLKSKIYRFSSTENRWETHFQFSSNRIWVKLVQVKWVSLCLFVYLLI